MNRSFLRLSLRSALLAAALLAPASALADGVLLGPSALGPHARTVQTRVVAERGQHPEAFNELAKVRDELPTLDANKRGRLPSLTPRLKALVRVQGEAAVWAMLEELVLDAKPRGKLSDTAWLGWRVALLEATGMARVLDAEAALIKILESKLEDPALVKAATEAVARLSTDSAASKLIALVKSATTRRLPMLEGLGHCRREAVADFLAAQLAGADDASSIMAIARALGDIGSALAWKTSAVTNAAHGEETAVRTTAAKALVGAYATVPEEARARVAQAVLVIDHTSTPSFIESARQSADVHGKALLDKLLARFQKSPLAKTR